jgi:hypothetical protein
MKAKKTTGRRKLTVERNICYRFAPAILTEKFLVFVSGIYTQAFVSFSVSVETTIGFAQKNVSFHCVSPDLF